MTEIILTRLESVGVPETSRRSGIAMCAGATGTGLSHGNAFSAPTSHADRRYGYTGGTND